MLLFIMFLKDALRAQPLNALTKEVTGDRWAVLAPHFSLVNLQPGCVTSAPEEEFTHALFPISAVIALHGTLAEDHPLESVLIGREGMLGIWAFAGRHATPQRSIVQFAGTALQVDMKILNAEFEASSDFRKLISRYSNSLLNYAIQTAVCYRHHDPTQQVARSLVMAARRIQSDCIPLTHTNLASVLGLRRETISVAAMRLASKGVIKQNHGSIEILKADELRALSCGCLGVFEDLYRDR
jgi:hypothetical protein